MMDVQALAAQITENLIIYIYFIYGMAFLSMGLAVLVELRRTSELRLARAVRLLGAFGVLHGLHEIMEMFIIIEGYQPLWVASGRVALLMVSFLALMAFGMQMLSFEEQTRRAAGIFVLVVTAAFAVQTVLVYFVYEPTFMEWLQACDVLSRYTLGVPGAGLAGFALIRQRGSMEELGMTPFGQDMMMAGLALIGYGIVGQLFPAESVVFPSMYVNADLFEEVFGFPVQLFRATMAVAVAVAMLRALRAFEEETNRQLATAIETERELQLAARELSLLYETSSLLTANYDLDRLVEEALERIVRIIDPIQAGIVLVTNGNLMDSGHVSAYGFAPDEVAEAREKWMSHCLQGTGPMGCWCWYDGHNRDISDKVKVEALAHPHIRPPDVTVHRAVLPLTAKQHAVGMLLLETAADGPYLSGVEISTIVALVRQLGVAIENARLVLQLRQREARRTELLQRVTAAQEAERKRIARELHDDTGQALTALALGLRGIERLMGDKPDVAQTQLVELQTISTHALEELRHMISDLRPSHLDDLGLVAALRWYVDQMTKRMTAEVVFSVRGQGYRLPAETETMLFRIAQEGVGNAFKHASADRVDVLLIYHQASVDLVIEDDGRGFDIERVMEPGAGMAWGLIGIQERVMLTGGELVLESAPGEGTCITVRVPVTQSEIEQAGEAPRETSNG